MRELIQPPTPRLAPADMVARLREVDPTAEMVYLGAGQWVVGSVSWHAERYRLGLRMIGIERCLPEEQQRPGMFIYARMVQQGIRPFREYTEAEVWSGYPILDFRRADWRFRNRHVEAFREAARNASDEPGIERRIVQALDAVHAVREDRGIIHYRRRGVVSPGPNWRN